MAEGEVKTVQQQISDFLTQALMSTGTAKGMILMIARENGAVATSVAGDFVTKIGLLAAAERRMKDLWNDSEYVEDED